MTDLYAEERRAWIAAHAGIWLFQKRRAELLGKRIRARSRTKVGTRPDPHDDQVTPPLVLRSSTTATGAVETIVVIIAAIAAPLGWPLGRTLYAATVRLIPERLQAYPTTALAWTAVVSGAPLPLLYDPRPSLASTLIVPWLVAQIPATFATASIYGVLEGWMAIDGSTDWWPLTPAANDIDDTLILGTAGIPMATVLDPQPSDDVDPLPRQRPAAPRWPRLAAAATIAAIGAIWYATCILAALLSHPAEILENTLARPSLASEESTTSDWRA